MLGTSWRRVWSVPPGRLTFLAGPRAARMDTILAAPENTPTVSRYISQGAAARARWSPVRPVLRAGAAAQLPSLLANPPGLAFWPEAYPGMTGT